MYSRRLSLQPTRPYYLRPDGKVGHDAFAVIRETIREMNKVAIGRVVLTNREHIIALEPLDKGLMGTLLRQPYEVRSEEEYFDEIQDVKVTKDILADQLIAFNARPTERRSLVSRVAIWTLGPPRRPAAGLVA